MTYGYPQWFELKLRAHSTRVSGEAAVEQLPTGTSRHFEWTAAAGPRTQAQISPLFGRVGLLSQQLTDCFCAAVSWTQWDGRIMQMSDNFLSPRHSFFNGIFFLFSKNFLGSNDGQLRRRWTNSLQLNSFVDNEIEDVHRVVTIAPSGHFVRLIIFVSNDSARRIDRGRIVWPAIIWTFEFQIF